MSIQDYQLQYEIGPIVLVGGVAGAPGAKLPIINLLQAQDYTSGLLSEINTTTQLEDFFAHFMPLPGSTLISTDIAHWPLATQEVAANAVITKPLRLAMLMICPASISSGNGANQKASNPSQANSSAFAKAGGAGSAAAGVTIARKQAIITALQSSLLQHINLGGWFDIATPAFLYQGMLMSDFTDASQVEEGGQVQLMYRMDFEQPIITAQQAQQAYNTGMGKIASGTQMYGNPPTANPAPNTVANPSSGVTPNVIPAAKSLAGASAGGPSARVPATP